MPKMWKNTELDGFEFVQKVKKSAKTINFLTKRRGNDIISCICVILCPNYAYCKGRGSQRP